LSPALMLARACFFSSPIMAAPSFAGGTNGAPVWYAAIG
jgi:hypothetical protein